jgi:hypothetical protein
MRITHAVASVAVTMVLAYWPQYDGSPWSAVHAVQTPQAPDQTANPEAGVRDALERYSVALESLDANSVKKIQPTVPIENLAKAFKEMRELKVDIDAVRVLSMDSATARVSCRVTQTLTPRVGARQTTAVNRVMRLRRQAGAWVIDGFER